MTTLNEATVPPALSKEALTYKLLTKQGFVQVGKDRGCLGNVYYELYGTGEIKLVFVNGMGADRQIWEVNLQSFASQKEFQVCVFDHRGTGYSDPLPILKYTTSCLAADANELLDHLGWSQDVNLVGASMGGMVALSLALSAPSKFSTVQGIINTVKAVLAGSPRERFEVNVNTLYPKEWLERPAPPGSAAANNREYAIQAGLQRLKNTRPITFTSFLGQTGAVMRHYISKEELQVLSSLFPDQRILVMVGTWDLLINTSNSRYLYKCIGPASARLVIFEGVGHSIASQEPAKFYEMVRQHILSHAS